MKSIAKTNFSGDNQTMIKYSNQLVYGKKSSSGAGRQSEMVTAHACTTLRMSHKIIIVDMDTPSSLNGLETKSLAYNGMFGVEKNEERRFKFYHQV